MARFDHAIRMPRKILAGWSVPGRQRRFWFDLAELGWFLMLSVPVSLLVGRIG